MPNVIKPTMFINKNKLLSFIKYIKRVCNFETKNSLSRNTIGKTFLTQIRCLEFERRTRGFGRT